MTVHRFHLPGAAEGIAELPDAAFGHVTRVLRLGEGDRLLVFDAGREFEATLTRVEKRRALVEIHRAVPALRERRAPLRLVMSPLKGDLTEQVIQKATELGVARLSPTVFERTDTVARRDPGDHRRERWRRVAISAAEQSGRAVVPEIDEVTPLAEVIRALGPPAAGERRLVAVEPSIDAASEPWSGPATSLIVAVGPAGGLTDADLDVLRTAGFGTFRLAPHTLRSETACIAALAIAGHPSFAS